MRRIEIVFSRKHTDGDILIEADVVVGHSPGTPQTWNDPGDPDEWWIESCVDSETGEPVELTLYERETLICQAINVERTQRTTVTVETESRHEDASSDVITQW